MAENKVQAFNNKKQRAAQNATAEAAVDPSNLGILQKDIEKLTKQTTQTQVSSWSIFFETST
jgi:hypothetical protein